MSKQIALILLLLVAAPLGAATTANDDTCDVGLYPAATLLLPYFQVDLLSGTGTQETTIFTVTNTGPRPQAARVTLWTDYAYPVISFNLYLTGYDVQKINLYDVLVRGRIAPDTEMGSETSPVGELSGDDNPQLDEETCARLLGELPAAIRTRMQSAFTVGRIPGSETSPECRTAGSEHGYAIGYATIDVVVACTPSLPIDPAYFTHEIRFDNVLIGDYIQIGGQEGSAQGNPMVHIRAIPEGGQQSTRRKTNLPRTFYSRYQPAVNQTADARQPLPSTFAARWISRGATEFETFYKIWREGATSSTTACSAYRSAATRPMDAARFDEDENVEVWTNVDQFREASLMLPAASLVNVDNEVYFPPTANEAVAGWVYLNLHDQRAGAATGSQNWVTTSMRAENRFSVDVDAVALGNGCSAPVTVRRGNIRPGTIGPAPNVTGR